MQFADLKLLPGAGMRITVPGASEKQVVLQAKYVGSSPPRSIVAALLNEANLRIGVKVAVSMTSPTGIVTFASQIEALSAAPFAHLFLLYPEAIHLRNVRAAVRVNVGVSAQVANLNADDHLEMQPSQIVDISVSGLRLAADMPLGEIGDELAVHMHISLDDIVRDIMLTGKIRAHTVAEKSGLHTYGVEFTELDENKRVLLYAYVFNMVQRYGAQM